jgi:DNA-directed RNA polymerase alpha subunit
VDEKTAGEDVQLIETQRRESPATAFWKSQGLSTRAANALARVGIGDLEKLRAARGRLGKIPNLGKVSQAEIESLLQRRDGG